jgi:hypothetical protein
MQSNTPTKTHLQAKNPMNALRMLIAVGSFAGFVGGWALLAQSGVPAAATGVSTASVVGSAPSQSQKSLTTATPVKSTAGVTSATVATTKPRLRTGGSR